MADMSHMVIELMRERDINGDGGGLEEDWVESTLGPKKDGLEEFMQKADDLQLMSCTL